ncbi:MAG: beta galactosidase jelly roll domain-containing protein, partial [Pyrinomonadaceae bacterium]|nr:beta galactosidase jelly roll domain-containing protein [Sphingobacteriaceae bacterium]
MKIKILLLFYLLSCYTVKAAIKLPNLVSDHMVLQRDKPITIWGYANPKEEIKIEFLKLKIKTVSNGEGKWRVTIPAMKAGGPYIMTLKGENEIQLKDILIGDVWICSGQSNMEFQLSLAMNADEEISNANYPEIRLYTVEKKIILTPTDDTKGSWAACTSKTAKDFSAIAYFFARETQKKLNIPIGLINSSWGGTVIESWISIEGLKGEPTFGEKALQVAKFDMTSYNLEHGKMDAEWIANFNKQDEGYINGKYLWASNEMNTSEWKLIDLPNIWEFTAIENLSQMDGIVWFRKDIVLNKDDLKGQLTLNLGVIQNADIAFVNGSMIGKTPDIWGKYRSYAIPEGILNEGNNTITLRVENYGGDGGFNSKASDFNLKTSNRLIAIAGNWNYKPGYKLTTFDRPEKEINPNTLPTLMYNNMVNPLINLSIKGVIWYQGESNWNRAYQYRELFPRMIKDWRTKFSQGDFPFLYVQLANHHEKLGQPSASYWAEVREAQDMTLKVKNTNMVAAIDLGDAGNIHPKNKQEVGRRLALAAIKTAYQLPVIASGPRYQSSEVKDGYILIHFSSTASGLLTKGAPA